MLTKYLSGNYRLRKEQVFEGLSTEDAKLLQTSAVTHTYKKGEIIFREGGIPAGIHYIESGHVKKFKATFTGGEQIIYICTRGELLGYNALLSGERYPDSTAAISRSEITFIPKESFFTVLSHSSELSNRLLKTLALEFSLYINNFTNLATRTVRERLSFTLLLLEEQFRQIPGTSGTVDIQLSRSDLANMIGTAKETLVRLLKEFKQKKLLQTTRTSIRIIDKQGVISEANLMGRASRKTKRKTVRPKSGGG